MTGRDGASAAEAEIGKYLDILAKDPRSRVFAPLAEAYRKAGLFDDAVQTALEGLKLHPNYLGGRVALARAYFEKRQFADAAAEMGRVVQAAPDNLMAHKILGQIALQQGNLAGAERSFRMVLMLDPRDAEAKQFLDSVAGTGAAATVAPGASAVAGAPAPPPVPEAAVAAAADVPPGPEPPAFAGERVDVASAMAVEEIALEEISIDVPEGGGLDAPPPGELVESVPALSPPEAIGPAPGDAEDDDAAPGLAVEPGPEGPELEIFTREPWGAAQPEAATPAEPVESPSPHGEDSPFEVFGRPRRDGPPPSTKGEEEAFREIDLETTAHAAADDLEPEAPDGSIEIFTREPSARESEERDDAARRAGRSEGGSFREIELETTAYQVPEPAFGENPELPLEEEIPRIDLAGEFEIDRAEAAPSPSEEVDDASVALVPGPPGDEAPADAAPEAAPEPDRFAFPDAVAPEEEVTAAGGAEYALAEEIPQVDLAAEFEDDFEAAAEIGPADREDDEEGADAGPGAQRGIFSTETLAAIYTGQGFHARAAEIYRGLLAERPGDPVLARKLEEALARDAGAALPGAAPVGEAPGGADAGAIEAVGIADLPTPGVGAEGAGGSAAEPPVEPAAPAGRGAEATVLRLEALMNAFRSRKGRNR